MSLKEFFESDQYREWITNYHNDHQHPVNRKIHEFGVPAILASFPLFLLGQRKLAAFLFVGGWAAQFVGHAIEGKPPTFTKGPLAGFVSGAAYFMDKWLVQFGIKDETLLEHLGIDETNDTAGAA